MADKNELAKALEKASVAMIKLGMAIERFRALEEKRIRSR